MTILIRDLSVYDPAPIDYGLYDGLIIRCFNGTSKDAKYDLHKAGAVIAGKPFWAYSFYNFLYPAEPQVESVINILHDERGAIPPAFDVEEWGGYRYPVRDVLLNSMRVLHDGIANAFGTHCQFYMNPATIHYLKPIPAWLLACPLWLAHWGVPQPDYEPWAKWTFWQHSGEPDLNKFNGTDEAYWAYVGGSAIPPPPDHPEVVIVTASVLNVRAAPMGAILGQVKSGWLLGVNGQSSYNGVVWYRIGTGYVSSQWVEEV